MIRPSVPLANSPTSRTALSPTSRTGPANANTRPGSGSGSRRTRVRAAAAAAAAAAGGDVFQGGGAIPPVPVPLPLPPAVAVGGMGAPPPVPPPLPGVPGLDLPGMPVHQHHGHAPDTADSPRTPPSNRNRQHQHQLAVPHDVVEVDRMDVEVEVAHGSSSSASQRRRQQQRTRTHRHNVLDLDFSKSREEDWIGGGGGGGAAPTTATARAGILPPVVDAVSVPVSVPVSVSTRNPFRSSTVGEDSMADNVSDRLLNQGSSQGGGGGRRDGSDMDCSSDGDGGGDGADDDDEDEDEDDLCGGDFSTGLPSVFVTQFASESDEEEAGLSGVSFVPYPFLIIPVQDVDEATSTTTTATSDTSSATSSVRFYQILFGTLGIDKVRPRRGDADAGADVDGDFEMRDDQEESEEEGEIGGAGVGIPFVPPPPLDDDDDDIDGWARSICVRKEKPTLADIVVEMIREEKAETEEEEGEGRYRRKQLVIQNVMFVRGEEILVCDEVVEDLRVDMRKNILSPTTTTDQNQQDKGEKITTAPDETELIYCYLQTPETTYEFLVDFWEPMNRGSGIRSFVASAARGNYPTAASQAYRWLLKWMKGLSSVPRPVFDIVRLERVRIARNLANVCLRQQNWVGAILWCLKSRRFANGFFSETFRHILDKLEIRGSYFVARACFGLAVEYGKAVERIRAKEGGTTPLSWPDTAARAEERRRRRGLKTEIDVGVNPEFVPSDDDDSLLQLRHVLDANVVEVAEFFRAIDPNAPSNFPTATTTGLVDDSVDCKMLEIISMSLLRVAGQNFQRVASRAAIPQVASAEYDSVLSVFSMMGSVPVCVICRKTQARPNRSLCCEECWKAYIVDCRDFVADVSTRFGAIGPSEDFSFMYGVDLRKYAAVKVLLALFSQNLAKTIRIEKNEIGNLLWVLRTVILGRKKAKATDGRGGVELFLLRLRERVTVCRSMCQRPIGQFVVVSDEEDDWCFVAVFRLPSQSIETMTEVVGPFRIRPEGGTWSCPRGFVLPRFIREMIEHQLGYRRN